MTATVVFTPCPRLGNHPAGLVCVGPAGHPFGHVYESTSGVAHCAKEEL
jgi:hypothetical protein